MELNLQATRVFERNWNSDNRIVVNQGGTRSSKTYSIAQLFAVLMAKERGKIFTICRKTLPALKATAMRDWINIMKELGLYSEEKHNKTDMLYKFGTNELEFVSIDQPQKIRGRKRDYLWMNEANEFDLEDFRQLSLRTSTRIYMDYNPSDEHHWLYTHVIPRKDADFIQSTYKDNPFLEDTLKKEIESYKDVDENYWRIYGLGERGVLKTRIYTHWKHCDALPEGEVIYGLDFGYNNPTALAKVVLNDDDIYAKEILYRSYMNTGDIVEEIRKEVGTKYVYCDSEDPQAIEELKKAGINALPAEKGKGSVRAGIDAIKKRKFYITKDSVNLLKEVKAYRWREKGDDVLDEPVQMNDHLLDAIRYCVFTHTNKPQPGLFVG